MKNTGTNKIFSGVKDFIKTTVLLIVLGAIVQVTGTTFFGVNLLPIIIAVVVFAIIIAGLASDKRTIDWINKKLNRMFK
jgi:hypothetical protein|tara:strand:- start:94 stop:330 length:237 start_codon:yes stop_codon:yes gene_type:complete